MNFELRRSTPLRLPTNAEQGAKEEQNKRKSIAVAAKDHEGRPGPSSSFDEDYLCFCFFYFLFFVFRFVSCSLGVSCSAASRRRFFFKFCVLCVVCCCCVPRGSNKSARVDRPSGRLECMASTRPPKFRGNTSVIPSAVKKKSAFPRSVSKRNDQNERQRRETGRRIG